MCVLAIHFQICCRESIHIMLSETNLLKALYVYTENFLDFSSGFYVLMELKVVSLLKNDTSITVEREREVTLLSKHK